MNKYQKFDEVIPFLLEIHLLNVEDWSSSQLNIKVFSNTQRCYKRKKNSHFSMIVNEVKGLFKSTNLKCNKVETLAFKKLFFVHEIELEGVVITLCYSILRVITF